METSYFLLFLSSGNAAGSFDTLDQVLESFRGIAEEYGPNEALEYGLITIVDGEPTDHMQPEELNKLDNEYIAPYAEKDK